MEWKICPCGCGKKIAIYHTSIPANPAEPDPFDVRIKDKMLEAEMKAWDALSRYKFLMFGYWAAIWVHYNKLLPKKQESPFRSIVRFAKNYLKQNLYQ